MSLDVEQWKGLIDAQSESFNKYFDHTGWHANYEQVLHGIIVLRETNRYLDNEKKGDWLREKIRAAYIDGLEKILHIEKTNIVDASQLFIEDGLKGILVPVSKNSVCRSNFKDVVDMSFEYLINIEESFEELKIDDFFYYQVIWDATEPRSEYINIVNLRVSLETMLETGVGVG